MHWNDAHKPNSVISFQWELLLFNDYELVCYFQKTSLYILFVLNAQSRHRLHDFSSKSKKQGKNIQLEDSDWTGKSWANKKAAKTRERLYHPRLELKFGRLPNLL